MGIFPSNSNASSTTPTAIVNYFSSGAVAPITIIGGNCKSVLSGALTAGVLKTILTIDSGGVLKFCAVQSQDVTSRTLQLKMTLDGVVVFNSTTLASTTSSGANIGVGGLSLFNATPTYLSEFEGVNFATSCKIEIASSLTETDRLALLVNYETR